MSALFSKTDTEPIKLRANLLRPEDMPGYTPQTAEEKSKDQVTQQKLDDGTTIIVSNTHHRKESLADIFEDFPDDIKKIVAPFV